MYIHIHIYIYVCVQVYHRHTRRIHTESNDNKRLTTYGLPDALSGMVFHSRLRCGTLPALEARVVLLRGLQSMIWALTCFFLVGVGLKVWALVWCVVYGVHIRIPD